MIDPSGKSFVVCLVRDVLSIALGYLPQPRIAFPVVHSGRELIKSHSAALIRAVRSGGDLREVVTSGSACAGLCPAYSVAGLITGQVPALLQITLRCALNERGGQLPSG